MKHFLLLAFVACTLTTYSQVGIGTAAPHSSAELDVTSANKGLLPPRMTYTERNAIANPVAGLLVWCSNCGTHGEMQVHNGLGWTNMIGEPATPPPPPGLGGFYEGGIIFYFFQSGDPGYVEGEQHGLIAATGDLPAAPWGCQYSLMGTSTALGSGPGNTNLIITNCLTEDIAARLCDDLLLNGFDDWYLPSKDELHKLYLNSALVGGFTNAYYYSSSEQNLDNAYCQNPVNGGVNYNPKSWWQNVRAIRSF